MDIDPASDASPGGSRRDRRIALTLGILALILYAVTSASVWDLPTVFSIDGAELVIACRELGIDHPPGHPLYLMLGFLFSRLPFASPDRGVVAVSVVAGAVTMAFMYLAALELTGRRLAALVAPVTLGLASIFWLHSAIVEVYTLQTALIALLTWLELRGLRRRTAGSAAAVAFAFGLTATSNMLLSVLLLPGLAIWLLGSGILSGPGLERRRRLARGLAGLLAGGLPFLYIPWRLEAGGRFINDLVFLSGYSLHSLRWYAWYLSGWEFVGHKVVSYGIEAYPRLVEQYLEAAWRNLTPPGAALTVLGAALVVGRLPGLLRLRRRGAAVPGLLRSRRRGAGVAGGWPAQRGDSSPTASGIGGALRGLVVLAGFGVTVLPVIGYQVPDREVFYLPSFLFATLLAAAGAAGLSALAASRARVIEAALAAGIVAVGLPAGWRAVVPITRDTSTYAARAGRFEALPKGAVIIGYDDGNASRYRYFQLVRGMRPDIAIETFGRHAPRYHGDLPADSGGLEEADFRAGLNMSDRIRALDDLARQYAGRPLFLLFTDEAPAEFPGYRVHRAAVDPRLLVLEKSPGVTRSDTPIATPVQLDAPWFPERLQFTGWQLKGLDNAGSTTFDRPLALGQLQVQGLILRGELFELSFVTRRLSRDRRQYFAQLGLLTTSGEILECPEAGFVASRQIEVLDADTPTGRYRRDGFDFKVPGACPAGPVILVARLYEASDEIIGEYKGKPIRRMSLVESSLPWQDQQELVPLGTLMVQ